MYLVSNLLSLAKSRFFTICLKYVLAAGLFFLIPVAKSLASVNNIANQSDSLLISVATEMQQILENYRANRDIIELFVARYGKNASVVEHIRQQFRADDSVALIKILSIVNTYGWKGKAHFGEAAPLTLIITFMHAGMNYRKKYFPLMEEAAKKGNLPAEGFAIIADQIALHDSGQQIYGTQFNFSTRLPNQYIPFPVAAVNEIDQRRLQIGLGPYQEFLKTYNAASLRQYCIY